MYNGRMLTQESKPQSLIKAFFNPMAILPKTSTSPVFTVHNEGLTSLLHLSAEHGGIDIPPYLNYLGLRDSDETKEYLNVKKHERVPVKELEKLHFLWDIGAKEVLEALSNLTASPAIRHNISRAVFETNRSPESSTLVSAAQDGFSLPINNFWVKGAAPSFAKTPLPKEPKNCIINTQIDGDLTTKIMHVNAATETEKVTTSLKFSYEKVMAAIESECRLTINNAYLHKKTPKWTQNTLYQDGIFEAIEDGIVEQKHISDEEKYRRGKLYGAAYNEKLDAMVHKTIDHAKQQNTSGLFLSVHTMVKQLINGVDSKGDKVECEERPEFALVYNDMHKETAHKLQQHIEMALIKHGLEDYKIGDNKPYDGNKGGTLPARYEDAIPTILLEIRSDTLLDEDHNVCHEKATRWASVINTALRSGFPELNLGHSVDQPTIEHADSSPN